MRLATMPSWCAESGASSEYLAAPSAAPGINRASSQLAVFAAAPVVAAELRDIAIVLELAGNAEAHTGDRDSAGLGDFGVAVRAARQRRSLRQLALDAADRVLDRRVDLLLHRPVARPTRRHCSVPPS